jgi:L-2-hydroxyglutarate oxidase LhgO
VIHAGIYYPSGLDKTRWCISGKAMLYDFCREYHVPHRQCGKLLVAVSETEIDKLSAIKAQAEANGVMDLVWLSGDEARALEPALAVRRALLSPSTGIIDSHALMHALRGDAERYGAMVALETPVLSGRVDVGGIIVETGGASPIRIAANAVVNSAGLGSQAFARSSECPPTRFRPFILRRETTSP